MNALDKRRVKGVVYYRNEDGSFSGDTDKIYYDEEIDGEEALTEFEKKNMEYFTATVLAPMFAEHVKALEMRKLQKKRAN